MKITNRLISTGLILLFILSAAQSGRNLKAQENMPPYKDPHLDIDKRVDDLVSRMTLEEKISQMQNAAPAIERLDIPEYEWWNEALQGVARSGIATVFPLGYGLSYTEFSYGNLKMPHKIKAGNDFKISVEIKNEGETAGEEVVQLYITDSSATVPVPMRSLAGIERIYLRPGEKRRVSFTIAPRQMSVITDAGKRLVEPGEFEISVGGEQPGFSGRTDAETTETVSGTFRVEGEFVVLL